MTHPCQSDDCEQSTSHSDHESGGCTHESECSDDPCSSLTVRIDRDDVQILIPTPQAVLLRSMILPVDIGERQGTLSPRCLFEPDVLTLACPESLLPLLI